MNSVVALLGCGHLGSAIAKRLLSDPNVPVSLIVADPNAHKLEALADTCTQTTTSSIDAVEFADTVILAMKPYAVQAALLSCAQQLADKLIISLAAGVPIHQLSTALPGNAPIARGMPNIPSLIGAGITGVFANPFVTRAQKELINSLLRPLGRVLWLSSENQLHAVTALSGSGPGYIFYIISAMVQAGCNLGLERKDSLQLVLDTVLGAAKMVQDTQQHPQTLQEQVATPGGTTEQGLNVFKAAEMHTTIAQAIAAAHARSVTIAHKV